MNLNDVMEKHIRSKYEMGEHWSDFCINHEYEMHHSDKLFFAVNKITGDFYKGKRNQMAFAKINYLTSSITSNLSKEEKDIYEYYRVFKLEGGFICFNNGGAI